MKNRAIEAMKQRAKQYHRNKRGDKFTNGVIVRHLYDDITPETLTFWDDAVFIVNDYRVALWTLPASVDTIQLAVRKRLESQRTQSLRLVLTDRMAALQKDMQRERRPLRRR